MSLTPVSSKNPCPICDRDNGFCKLGADSLVLCSTVHNVENTRGYRRLKISGDWAVFAPSRKGSNDDYTPAIPIDRAKSIPSNPAPTATECDRGYRQMLAGLRLNLVDRDDLLQRGFTTEQIERSGFKSVDKWQPVSFLLPALPGILPGKNALNVGDAGYLCPIHDVDGLIVGFQVRARAKDAQRRYYWLSSKTQKDPTGMQPKPLYEWLQDKPELPLAVYYPSDPPGDRRIALCEGTGPKPFLACERTGLITLGAAGGNFASSSQTFEYTLKRLQAKRVRLYPDAGAVKNPHVMRSYLKTFDLLKKLDIAIEIGWWNQVEKAAGDVDEISDFSNVQIIEVAEFLAIAASFGALEKSTPAQIKGARSGEHLKGRRSDLPPVVRETLTRKPCLHIGTDEFKQHVGSYPQSGILALHGAKGSGKGEAIAQVLQGRSWLSVTTLRSLARDQASGWNGVFLNDADKFKGRYLSGGEVVKGGSVCVPSLLKAKGLSPEVLVLDELPTVLEFLKSSQLANRDGIRPLLIEELRRRIAEADQVIIASADLTDSTLEYVEQIRGERAFVVRTDRKPLAWQGYLMADARRGLADLEKRLEALPDGKLCLYHTDNKSNANRVATLLKRFNPLLITSSTSGGEVESSFLSSKGADLPALAMAGTKLIVTSPSVKEGFSIQHHTDRIDSVWGVFSGCSITANAVAQTLDRVRSLAPRYFFIARKGNAHSKISDAETVAEFMRDFKQSSKDLAMLTRRSLQIETQLRVDRIDWGSQSFKLFAEFEVQRNRDMTRLRDNVVAILQSEGKRLEEYQPISSAKEGDDLAESLNGIADYLKQQHAEALEKAPTQTEQQIEALERKESLTPDEQLAIEKYYLIRFYRAESLTIDEILWDEKGERRRAIRNLERVLNPDLAESASAKSIERNSSTPQDWEKARLRLEILEETGAADFIRKVWSGELAEVKKGVTEKIVTQIRSQAERFRLAFNYRVENIRHDNQIMAYVLDWVGFDRDSSQRREDGERKREYFVCQDNLQKLQTIVSRRFQDVTPPLVDHLNGGGVTPALDDDLEPEFAKYDAESLAEIREWFHGGPEFREIVQAMYPEQVIRLAIAA